MAARQRILEQNNGLGNVQLEPNKSNGHKDASASPAVAVAATAMAVASSGGGSSSNGSATNGHSHSNGGGIPSGVSDGGLRNSFFLFFPFFHCFEL